MKRNTEQVTSMQSAKWVNCFRHDTSDAATVSRIAPSYKKLNKNRMKGQLLQHNR